MKTTVLKSLVTSLIVLAFLVFSSFVVFAQSINTGDANAFTCIENIVNNSNYTDWYNDNCDPTLTPTPTETPTPTPDPCANGQCVTPTVTPTPTQTPNVGGPGDGRSDGLGCASHDCSGNSAPQGQVLGASTGPQVLGLSTTSSGSNSLLNLFQLLGAFTLTVSGFSFFKKNA